MGNKLFEAHENKKKIFIQIPVLKYFVINSIFVLFKLLS